jgi:hypothetical protein
MKKIIAISVMLALIAGAVFADTAVGGGVETRFSLAKQTGNDGDDPVMGGSIGAAQIRLSGSNADGTLGGMFNLRNTDIVRSAQWFHRVFAWWKPVPQVRVWLGIDQDGLFDTANFVGWAFHAGDNDYIFNHHWDFWREIFPGNWDGFGLALSFYPMPGFDLNVVLPTGGVNWPQATSEQVGKAQLISGDGGMLPGRILLNGGYSLDFGRIAFTYQGKDYVTEKGLSGYGSLGAYDDLNGRFGLSLLFTALEGIDILVGGSVVLATDMLISGGVGVVYNGDGFGVKVRAGLQMQGDADMFITANIMPFLAVGEKGQFLFDIQITNDGNKDPGMGWAITPAYRLGIDGGAFKIGLQVYSNINSGGNSRISGADYVKWNIPMLLAFNF